MAYKRNFSSMDFDFKVGWGRFTIWGKGNQSETQNSNNVTFMLPSMVYKLQIYSSNHSLIQILKESVTGFVLSCN